MKFKINRDHFSSGLQQVLNLVSPRATMPILGNVLIEAEGDTISLTTTNLDLGIRCGIKAQVEESGAIPGASLADHLAADRITARIVAHCLRRTIDRSPQLRAIVATSHDDLEGALRPDLIARCDFGQVQFAGRPRTTANNITKRS
jgi:hypothetical protein